MFHMNDCAFISEINETCVEKVLCIFLSFSGPIGWQCRYDGW